MDTPEPLTMNNNSLVHVVTAIIFFLLGFFVAGLLGFSIFGAEPYADPEMVKVAVNETFIALTPSPTPSPTPAPVQLTFSDRDHLLAGSWDAPVMFVEFSDYRCPWCGVFAREVLPALLETYGDTVGFVYRDYPIFGEESVRGAHGAFCASEQNNFMDYHFALFASQSGQNPLPLVDANLMLLAEDLGLDSEAFSACLARENISQEIVQNYIDGQNLLLQAGTPTFLINGRRFSGAGSVQFFSRILNEELEKQGIEPPT